MTAASLYVIVLIFTCSLHIMAIYFSLSLLLLLNKFINRLDKLMIPRIRFQINIFSIVTGILASIFVVAGLWIAVSMDPSLSAATRAGIGPNKDIYLNLDLFILAFAIYLFPAVNMFLSYSLRIRPNNAKKIRILQTGFLVMSALFPITYFHILAFMVPRM